MAPDRQPCASVALLAIIKKKTVENTGKKTGRDGTFVKNLRSITNSINSNMLFCFGNKVKILVPEYLAERSRKANWIFKRYFIVFKKVLWLFWHLAMPLKVQGPL